jgi:hypothetical protein
MFALHSRISSQSPQHSRNHKLLCCPRSVLTSRLYKDPRGRDSTRHKELTRTKLLTPPNNGGAPRGHLLLAPGKPAAVPLLNTERHGTDAIGDSHQFDCPHARTRRASVGSVTFSWVCVCSQCGQGRQAAALAPVSGGPRPRCCSTSPGHALRKRQGMSCHPQSAFPNQRADDPKRIGDTGKGLIGSPPCIELPYVVPDPSLFR